MNAPFANTVGDDVDLGALSESIGFLLRLAQVRLFGQFFETFEGTDVRPGEITVLWVIDINPRVRQGTLASTLHIKPAHMTKLVQRMVRDGLVRREVPPSDRRSVYLELTPAGKAYLEGHRPAFLRVHTAERLGISPDEYATLLTLIRKIALLKEPQQCP